MTQLEDHDGLVETPIENIHDHMRRRRSIIKAWLDRYPQEWRGMRTALALELYGQGQTKDGQLMANKDGSPRPSFAAKMAVKRDLDVIRVWSAAVEAHRADPTKPMPSMRDVEAVVINAGPAQIAAALECAKRGELVAFARAITAGRPLASVKAADAIERVETTLDWLERTEDVTDLERVTLVELVQEAERIIRSLPRLETD